jgi:hypothetical protein
MKRLTVAVLAVTVGMMTSLTIGGGTAQAAVLETIAVPSTGSAVLSSTSLASGTTYWIRASGAMSIGTVCSQPDADAEYYCFDQGGPTDICLGVDNGVGINDSTNDGDKFPSWGLYNPAHIYTVTFVGLGAPVALNYHDCVYGDNSGSITVEILSTNPGGVVGNGFGPRTPPYPLHRRRRRRTAGRSGTAIGYGILRSQLHDVHPRRRRRSSRCSGCRRVGDVAAA